MGLPLVLCKTDVCSRQGVRRGGVLLLYSPNAAPVPPSVRAFTPLSTDPPAPADGTSLSAGDADTPLTPDGNFYGLLEQTKTDESNLPSLAYAAHESTASEDFTRGINESGKHKYTSRRAYPSDNKSYAQETPALLWTCVMKQRRALPIHLLCCACAVCCL